MSSIRPPPPTMQAGSSSSTLYAQPSKEWKIPPKPKPGRKPKNPVIAPVPEIELSEEARKNQNRAAQRAFRERKQDQLATLQSRLQQYEQGETERHVQLQTLGKRLKEENDLLRKENAALKEEVALLRAGSVAGTPRVKLENIEVDLSAPPRKRTPSVSSVGGPKKRPRMDSTAVDTIEPSLLSAPSPRASISLGSTGAFPSNTPSSTSSSSFSASTPSTTYASTPSSSSMVSSPASMLSPHSSALHQHNESARSPLCLSSITSSSLLSSDQPPKYSSSRYGDKSTTFQPSGDLQIVDCGFCSEDTPCICRELALRDRNDQGPDSSPVLRHVPITEKSTESAHQPHASPKSILDNLPAYQPPVPLRKRRQGPSAASSSSVFPVYTHPSPLPPTSSQATATCSGDPSNCGACKDDPFGRAFCSALNAACTEGRCPSCPGRNRNLVEVEPSSMRRGSGPSLSCCGNAKTCSGAGCGVLPSLATMHPAPAPPMFSTIPTSSAWATLKAHPAIQKGSFPFSNLNLLADVVAKRSKCTGPKVVIEPALGSLTPERSSSPAMGSTSQVNSSVQCGHDRVTAVRAEGVQAALAILDDHVRRNDVEEDK